MNNKTILDACCGSKIFWFDKKNPNVEFCDNRIVPRHEYYPQKYIEINPDTVCDFTALPFPDKAFKLVVFDHPHLTRARAGETSYMRLKYGWQEDKGPQGLHDGVNECMRVRDEHGTLIFKW